MTPLSPLKEVNDGTSVDWSVATASGPTNRGRFETHSNRAAPRLPQDSGPGGAPSNRSIPRIARPCRTSPRCTGGLWTLPTMVAIADEAKALMELFLERGDLPGFYLREQLYNERRHAEVLGRVSEDWAREASERLMRRKFVDSDPHERMPRLCGEHLRHALRVDLALDRGERDLGLDVGGLECRDALHVGEITAAACWVPELTSLLLLARRRRWITPQVRDEVVAAVQRLPRDFRWPVRSSLFHTPGRPSAGERAEHRRTASVVQRDASARVREVRRSPSRRRVKAIINALRRGTN